MKITAFKNSRIVVCLVLLFLSNACNGGWTKVKIISNVDEVVIGDNIDIRIEGLEAGKLYQVQLELIEEDDKLSSATYFEANDNGVIDLDKDWSFGDYYEGVDSLGLFYTLGTHNRQLNSKEFHIGKGKSCFVFQVFDKEKLLATKQIIRLTDTEHKKHYIIDDAKHKIEIHDTEDTKILVLVLGGSEGNNEASNIIAKLLAAKGYPTAAISYFGGGYQVKSLVNIPLEILDSSRVLIEEKIGEKEKVILIGASRGAELALIYASFREDIDGVIALAPSSHVFPGQSYNMLPAWTIEGEALPFVKMKYDIPERDKYGNAVWVHHYLKPLQNAQEESRIKIERINGDVLLFSGKDDLMWPAAYMADQLYDRALENNFGHDLLNVQYEDCGHLLTPYCYFTEQFVGDKYAFGGMPKENAYAKLDVWQRMLSYLESKKGP